MYKEVHTNLLRGGPRLEIPDDVTLLFSDDNYGTIRRLPTDAEQERSGGIGVSNLNIM